jgi:hypothetical protein
VLIAPGYALLTRRGASVGDAITFGPAVTIGIVAAAVLLSVVVDAPPEATSYLIVIALVAGTVLLTFRRRTPGPSWAELRPVLLLLFVFAFLVGFSLVPSNPRFHTDILGRPLAQATKLLPNLANPRLPARGGDHILQFRAEQAVWYRFVPAKGQFHFAWRFQDRTPLVGFVAAGLAGPPGAAPPVTYPGSPLGPRHDAAAKNLEPFAGPTGSSFGFPSTIDPWGFWFYRLLVMSLSCLVLLPVFRLASDLFDGRVGTLAVVAAGLSPALMLSAYYPSPKNLAAYFGLLSVLLVRQRQPWLAGLAIGGAYLAHPLGVFLGGAAIVYQAVLARGAALKMALGLAPAVAAWTIYGATTGVRSTLLLNPLGCFDVGVSTRTCFENYRAQGVAIIVWDRFSSLISSIVPEALVTPLLGSGYDAARFKWFDLHDFSYGGLVGLIFFAAVVIGLVRAYSRYRLEIVVLLGVQLLLISLAWGFGDPSAHIGGIGMLPLLFAFGAYGITTLGERAATVVLALVAIEGLLYFAALIEPVPGVATLAYLLMAVLCVGAAAALIAIGFWSIRQPPGHPRPLAPSRGELSPA